MARTAGRRGPPPGRRRVLLGRHRRHSTSERPVRRRNTSSKRAAPHQRALRAEPPVVHRDERGLAVVGVEQEPVGQHLAAVGEVGHLLGQGLVLARAEAQLEDLPGGVLLDERAGRPLGDDAAAVHHHEPVAQLLGLVHVVGGEDQADALLLEAVEPVPQGVAGLRVEARRRLVEQQQLRLVDEAARDGEPALQAPGERLDPAAGPLAQLHEVEQLVGALADELAGQVEVAPVDEEVVADRQLQVEAVLLGHDPEPAPDLGALGGRVAAQHPQGAGRRR